jgi:hypothetical protein
MVPILSHSLMWIVTRDPILADREWTALAKSHVSGALPSVTGFFPLSLILGLKLRTQAPADGGRRKIDSGNLRRRRK